MKSLIPRRWRRGELPVRRMEANPIEELHRQVESLFDEFLGGFGASGPNPWRPGTGRPALPFPPRCEMTESRNAYELEIEVPGFSDRDIEVSVDENTLTVRGEQRTTSERKGRDGTVSERRYGSFHRTLALPAGVVPDGIRATCRNGILTVTLPKLRDEDAGWKRIAVRSE